MKSNKNTQPMLDWIRKNKIFILIILVLLISGRIISTMSPKSSNQTQETVKIGITLPISGDLAYLTANYRAIILYVEKEINSNPNNKYKYQFIIEDNAFDGKKASLNVNKFISIDKVDALVSATSKIGNIISPIADKYSLIHMNPLASDENVAKGKYNFINWTQPDAQCQKLVEQFVKKGIKKVVTYTANDAGAHAVGYKCNEMMEANNIEHRYVVSNYNEKDFRTTLLKNVDFNPDIYFVLHYPPAINLIVKQMRENNINTEITSIEAPYFTGGDPLFNDMWFVASAEVTKKNMDIFNAAKVNDSIYGVGHMYDSLHMLYNAFEKSGKDKDKIAAYLSSLDHYKGIIGDVSITGEGVFQSKAILKIIKDGKILDYEG